MLSIIKDLESFASWLSKHDHHLGFKYYKISSDEVYQLGKYYRCFDEDRRKMVRSIKLDRGKPKMNTVTIFRSGLITFESTLGIKYKLTQVKYNKKIKAENE